MANLMKIKCNGENQHVNAVDLEQALQPTVVLRGRVHPQPPSLPARLVLPCRFCTEGKLVITREMMQAFRNRKP